MKFNFDNLISPSKRKRKETSEVKNETTQAQDGLDQETLYNLPGYQEEFFDKELEADNETGGETGDLLEKYGLEEWELKDIGKQCLLFSRGEKNNPFKDEEKTREILSWYLDYLKTENEYGLALSEVELNRLTDGEKQKLANLYKRRVELNLKIAELNNNIRELANIAHLGQMSSEYSTKTKDAKNDLIEYREEAKSLYNELKNNSKNISSLEEKAFTDQEKKEKEEKERQERIKKEKEERELEEKYQEAKESKPEYSEAELKLHQECLDYFSVENKKKEVPVYENKKLDKDQLERTAREAAIERIRNGEMDRANFFAKTYKGKRQLVFIDKFYDEKLKEEKKTYYIYESDNMPTGRYAFKTNPSTMFNPKNNPNIAYINIDLMIDIGKPKKRAQKTI